MNHLALLSELYDLRIGVVVFNVVAFFPSTRVLRLMVRAVRMLKYLLVIPEWRPWSFTVLE